MEEIIHTSQLDIITVQWLTQ